MDSNKMEPALIALDSNSGDVIWTWTSGSHSKHGGVRSVIMDGNRIIGTGYVNSPEPGKKISCLFTKHHLCLSKGSCLFTIQDLCLWPTMPSLRFGNGTQKAT